LDFCNFYQNIYKKEGQNWVITLNMARNMLKTKKIPNEFWVEVVDCVVYLSNSCSIKELNAMTPQKAWNVRKSSDTHLKMFRSIGYMHVDSQGPS
jgi:hypothetical protein